ncbi:MAG: hypothetical protein JOZ47_10835 [Kutzneria sp.]|nr:hypothetical protein [Kutzneria sp.]MBV9845556.1 hypothetical protein [Kutzneria sp.]
MLILRRDGDDRPVVAEVGRPWAAVAVTDESKHHLTVRLDDGRDELHLVLAREVAALLVARLLPHTAPNVVWLQGRGAPNDG